MLLFKWDVTYRIRVVSDTCIVFVHRSQGRILHMIEGSHNCPNLFSFYFLYIF